MAVPHTRLVMAGVNSGGNDWSIGLSVGLIDQLSQSDLQAWLDSCADAIATSYNNGSSAGWGYTAASTTTLNELRAYTYPQGSGAAAAQAVHTFSSPKAGIGPGSTAYTQCVVASLLTGKPGRKNRGRVYLPCDGQALTNHQLTQANCTGIASGVVSLIDAVNGSIAAGGNPAVIVAGPGQTTPLQVVTQVRVDSLTDVQRRRQDKINPTATVVQNV